MPEYFFRVNNESELLAECGIELPNDSVAKHEAARLAGALLVENPSLLWETQDCRVKVSDADDHLIAIVATIGVDASEADSLSVPE